jgi:hypothetical protein
MFKRFGLIRVLARGHALALLLIAGAALAEDKDPLAIFELGAAGEWGFNGGSSFGPAAAIEFNPIKNWLEIEIGVTTLFSKGQTEWETDFVFKSHSICRQVSSLSLVLGRFGCTPLVEAEQPTPSALRPCLTSCSGQQRIETTVGSWNRATRTLSPAVTNNRSA